MSKYSNFQSHDELQARRDEVTEARKMILEKAKEKYEKEERRREKAKRQGEGSWMLDAVALRIQKEEKALENIKKDKKKKKKEKKKKKKKKEKTDSSSSSNDESDQEQWIEAQVKPSQKAASDASCQMKGPQLQRESWMEAPIDLLPSISRQDIRAAVQKEKEEAKREAEKLSAPGQHARELNPYWRDGGTGLPEEKKKALAASSSQSFSSVSGDGGVSWLRKAYQRCQDQAKEEGRSLEDVAAERWGSLSRLRSLMEEAEKKVGTARDEMSHSKSDRQRNERHDARYQRGDEEREKRGRQDTRYQRGDEEREKRGSHGHRDSERRRSEEGDRKRDGHFTRDSQWTRGNDDKDDYRHGNNKNRSYHAQDRDNGRGRDKRTDKRYEEDRIDDKRGVKKDNSPSSYRHSTFRHPHSDDEEDKDRKMSSSSSLSSRFRRPVDDDVKDEDRKGRSFTKPENRYNKNSKFKRPDESDDDSPSSGSPWTDHQGPSSRNQGRESRSRNQSEDTPRWKKAVPGQTGKAPQQGVQHSDSTDSHRMREKKSRRASISTSSSCSSSGSSSEDQVDSEKEAPHSDEDENSSLPAKIMSEEELNELAAKILRAEIMGEEAFAAELKAKLENARQQREASKSAGQVKDFACSRPNVKGQSQRGGVDEADEDNVVVLTRTNKDGMIRPVLGASDEWGKAKGQKRKKKNVATHGDQGDRKRFFHDDDKYDLKTLVEREKAGTAEDQNMMFARLAGRAAGDRDLDVDDMFVSKAAKNQDEEQAVNRDRMAAIYEHRKINAAMEKCQYCFNKIPKHLIIAIGTKTYLCLPPHRSLADGQCWIVPMGHVTSATSMDEDVWQEIQRFRQSVVQMFNSQDQDVVVMETVMHLKHFPHTTIECIPLEREVGDLAPIYFKKAIQDAGPEWSDNKKLHDLSKKDIRRVIPKGFPYFSVDFGLQGGFAHVIEEEPTFPSYFGREIVGGMLDAEPSLWRKPHKQSFEDQRQRVLQFEKWYSPFDWTRQLNTDD